jgi:Uma2 family endonuclease
MTSPASKRHQDIADFLVSILRAFVEVQSLGIILSAPFQMRVGNSGREPDLLFVAQANIERLKKTYLDGPADLAVEIISPESATRDRGAKFYEYEAAGIPEYWLIDPMREQAEFYQLDERGYYQLIRPDEGEVYTSKMVPGLRFPVAWLWKPPAIIAALKSLGLVGV